METYKNSVEHVTDDDDGHDDELAVEEGKRTICKPNGSLITSISNSSLPVVVLAMILPASLPDVCGSPQNWSQFFLCMLLLLHTTIVVVVGQIMTGRRLLESPVPSFSVILSLAGAQCSAPPTIASLLALSLFISCQIICVALCIFFGASYRTLYGIRSSFRVVFFLLLDVLCHI